MREATPAFCACTVNSCDLPKYILRGIGAAPLRYSAFLTAAGPMTCSMRNRVHCRFMPQAMLPSLLPPALSAPRLASQAASRSAAAKSAGIDDMFRSSRPANLSRPVHIQIKAPAFHCLAPSCAIASLVSYQDWHMTRAISVWHMHDTLMRSRPCKCTGRVAFSSLI